MKVFTFRGQTLPEELQESITAYVEQGRPTGGFLQAVIDNDLSQAFARADESRIAALPAIVAFFYNEAPASCWGRRGAAAEWIERKRQEREKENHVSH